MWGEREGTPGSEHWARVSEAASEVAMQRKAKSEEAAALSASRGDNTARLSVGLEKYTGSSYKGEDKSEAIAQWEAAADNDNGEALNNLGMVYLTGNGGRARNVTLVRPSAAGVRCL